MHIVEVVGAGSQKKGLCLAGMVASAHAVQGSGEAVQPIIAGQPVKPYVACSPMLEHPGARAGFTTNMGFPMHCRRGHWRTDPAAAQGR